MTLYHISFVVVFIPKAHTFSMLNWDLPLYATSIMNVISDSISHEFTSEL